MKYILIIGLLFQVMVGCNKDSSSNNFASSPGQGGSMARFAIAGNYLYTVDKEKLKVFSLISPDDPVLKNTVNIGFEIETIYPFGDKLFIGSTSVVHIFSIADPERPEKLSTAIAPTVLRRCDPVVAKDTVAYATLRTNGECGGMESQLVAYDIHNITNPIITASIPVFEPYGLAYADTVLYVCDKNNLGLFSIKKPYAPRQFATIGLGNWYFDVIPYGNSLICWIRGGMIIYDITNKATPQFIAKII